MCHTGEWMILVSEKSQSLEMKIICKPLFISCLVILKHHKFLLCIVKLKSVASNVAKWIVSWWLRPLVLSFLCLHMLTKGFQSLTFLYFWNTYVQTCFILSSKTQFEPVQSPFKHIHGEILKYCSSLLQSYKNHQTMHFSQMTV